MINLALFVCSAAMLYYIVRYRIHFHVTLQVSRRGATETSAHSSEHGRRSGGSSHRGATSAVAAPISGVEEPRKVRWEPATVAIQADLVSALVNQGCPRKKATETVKTLLPEWNGGNFDELLRKALRRAA